MTNLLETLLSERDWLLGDGATGTNLFNLGLEARKVVVAGSMGPTGEIMQPVGALSHADAVEMFEEQAQGLMDGGADVLWVETISAARPIFYGLYSGFPPPIPSGQSSPREMRVFRNTLRVISIMTVLRN